jgi:hypothetical protein
VKKERPQPKAGGAVVDAVKHHHSTPPPTKLTDQPEPAIDLPPSVASLAASQKHDQCQAYRPEGTTPQSKPPRSTDPIDPGRIMPAGLEPMLSIDELAALLNCSRRLIERMRSAAKLPPPDLHVGRMPRWTPTTIQAWIVKGGRP